MARKTTTPTSTGNEPRRVFVDTGGWYAVVARSDRHHEAATQYYVSLLDTAARIVTSDYVLDETLTRLRYDFGHAVALKFWEQIEEAQAARLLTILRVEEQAWQAALDIFRKYDDQDFSFTDCTSFALVGEHRVNEVFAFDRHFLMFGLAVQPVV